MYAVPFLACFHFSSGLVMARTFGVHLEPTLAPVLAWVCLALLTSDEASERRVTIGNQT